MYNLWIGKTNRSFWLDKLPVFYWIQKSNNKYNENYRILWQFLIYNPGKDRVPRTNYDEITVDRTPTFQLYNNHRYRKYHTTPPSNIHRSNTFAPLRLYQTPTSTSDQSCNYSINIINSHASSPHPIYTANAHKKPEAPILSSCQYSPSTSVLYSRLSASFIIDLARCAGKQLLHAEREKTLCRGESLISDAEGRAR